MSLTLAMLNLNTLTDRVETPRVGAWGLEEALDGNIRWGFVSRWMIPENPLEKECRREGAGGSPSGSGTAGGRGVAREGAGEGRCAETDAKRRGRSKGKAGRLRTSAWDVKEEERRGSRVVEGMGPSGRSFREAVSSLRRWAEREDGCAGQRGQGGAVGTAPQHLWGGEKSSSE